MTDISKALDELADLPGFNYPGGVKPRRTPAPTVVKAAPAVSDWDSHPRVKRLKGVEVEFFSVGALAAAVGCSPVTVRAWERTGRLPLSVYRSPAPKSHGVAGKKPMGHRLYTRHQIEVVIEAAQAVEMRTDYNRIDWPKFTKIVVDGWKLKR